MKQSVALASSYLSNSLSLDISVVDVEMVLSVKDIVDSDGCVACGFLDAGCAFIVLEVDEENKGSGGGLEKVFDALEILRLPRERIVLHFPSMGDLEPFLENDSKEGMGISSKVGTVSMFCSSAPESCKDVMTKMKNCWGEEKVRLVVQLDNNSKNSSFDESNNKSNCKKELTPQELSEIVSKLSKSMGEDNGSISLVDPTAEELGLSYAACIRTDREDGLFTTVVCSRGNEALGLVYSSKVSRLQFFD